MPGATPFTRTAGPRATARFRTRASIAAFAAECGMWRGHAFVAATSETRRIAPSLFARAFGRRLGEEERGPRPDGEDVVPVGGR